MEIIKYNGSEYLLRNNGKFVYVLGKIERAEPKKYGGRLINSREISPVSSAERGPLKSFLEEIVQGKEIKFSDI